LEKDGIRNWEKMGLGIGKNGIRNWENMALGIGKRWD
jgi:hypothetical protein